MFPPFVKKQSAGAPNWFRSRAIFGSARRRVAALGIKFEGEQHVEEYVDWKTVSDRFRPDRGTPHLHGPQRLLGRGGHNAGNAEGFGGGRQGCDACCPRQSDHTGVWPV